jgi:hypothetical protein
VAHHAVAGDLRVSHIGLVARLDPGRIRALDRLSQRARSARKRRERSPDRCRGLAVPTGPDAPDVDQRPPLASREPQLGKDLVGFLSELHALSIDLFLHQQGLDTTTPAGKAMFQMMGVFAEFERSMIRERVRAGLARAVAEGTKLGRPTIPQAKEDAIRAALAKPGRPGVRKIAKQFGVDPSTVQRISRPFDDGAARVA